MQTIKLNNGVEMPMVGYGVFQIKEAEECERCVRDALDLGCRLIDTAASYGNEAAVGKALRDSGIPREEVFITTKVWLQDAGYERTKAAFQKSLDVLGLDYLDIYLIHQPFGDYYGSWRAMEELYRAGRIRTIGVCNFAPDRLVDLCMNSEVPPALNQIELHPFYQQADALQIMEKMNVQPQAWGPLSEGQKDIFRNKILSKIAQKYNKTVAQVILRWHIQRNVIVIPKSTHKERIAENMDIWDFELSEKDIEIISRMDIGYSEIIDHRCACTARQLNSWKIHD